MSQLQAIFDQYNGKLSKLVLNTQNIEIINVQPHSGANGENTLVDFRYDRAMDAEGTIDVDYDPESRFGERSVEITRHDIADVFASQLEDLGTALNQVVTGVVLGKSDAHRDAFIAAVAETHALSASDIDAVLTGGYISIVARPMSLGFIGKLSVTKEDASPEGESS